MQKKLKSFAVVASLVVSLAIVFVACGKGEISEYLEQDLNLSVEDFLGKCLANDKPQQECVGNLDSSYSSFVPTPPPSSAAPQSSIGGTSSQGGGGTSSQGGGGTSSQGGGGTSSQGGGTSSTTQPTPTSSSSQGSQGSTTCPDAKPKTGFDCAWDFKASATNPLTPGKTIKPEKSGDDAGCSIKWLYKPTTGPLAKCSELSSEGVVAEGGRVYLLFAVLDCGGTSYVNYCKPTEGLSSKLAPELNGTCKWDRSPAVTTSAKGAKPSGVTFSDPDGVCSSPSVVYKYDDGSKTWNDKTGLLEEWGSGIWKTDKKHKETYSDVTPTLNCPAYPIPVTVAPCPPLEVSAGADYQITCSGGQLGDCPKLEGVKDDECIDVELNWTDSHNTPTVKFACQVKNSSTGNITIKFGGKETAGQYYLPVDIGKISGVGKLEFNGICVRLSGGGTADCNLTQ